MCWLFHVYTRGDWNNMCWLLIHILHSHFTLTPRSERERGKKNSEMISEFMAQISVWLLPPFQSATIKWWDYFIEGLSAVLSHDSNHTFCSIFFKINDDECVKGPIYVSHFMTSNALFVATTWNYSINKINTNFEMSFWSKCWFKFVEKKKKKKRSRVINLSNAPSSSRRSRRSFSR